MPSSGVRVTATPDWRRPLRAASGTASLDSLGVGWSSRVHQARVSTSSHAAAPPTSSQ